MKFYFSSRTFQVRTVKINTVCIVNTVLLPSERVSFTMDQVRSLLRLDHVNLVKYSVKNLSDVNKYIHR